MLFKFFFFKFNDLNLELGSYCWRTQDLHKFKIITEELFYYFVIASIMKTKILKFRKYMTAINGYNDSLIVLWIHEIILNL